MAHQEALTAPLRHDVERGSKEGLASAKQDLTMQWRDLSFRIGNKQILHNVTGLVRSGRLTGVLGPSGSGKSTLLNVLAGRQRTDAIGMELGGEIRVSGVPIDPSTFRSNIAYVMQDDSLLATETPRECLRFSAYLRLPRGGGQRDHEELVQRLLATLQLTKCADTIVGNALVKGISGGERKRTSVGTELITDPKVLFLDEPLSGLDSYAAYTLVEALRALVSAGVLVFCSVHQPSSEIFEMFDDVVFLHDGEVAYHGPVREVVRHFAQLDFECKSSFNPADHVMFLLQKEPPESVTVVKRKWLTASTYTDMVGEMEKAVSAASSTSSHDFEQRSLIHHQGPCKQLIVLLKREFRGTLRNKGILGARIGMSIFLSSLYGWLFAGAARNGDEAGADSPNCRPENFQASSCSGDFQAHYGTLVSLSVMSMMGAAQPVLLSFPDERPVFLREYAARQYGVLAYFISKTVVELPVVLATTMATFLIDYWLMGLHGNFLYLVLTSWALGVTSSSISLLIGCGVASAQKAIQLAPLALIPQMLFSGLFLPVAKIPTSLRWVQYLCPLKYAINLLTCVEFQNIKDRIDNCQGDPRVELPGDVLRERLIEGQEVKWERWTFYIALLAVLYAGFRTVAALLLWRKGKYVY